MIDYNTNQWIIMHYPQAAGGKFLSTCFMMFDNVTNWAEKEFMPSEIVNWYNNSIPESTTWFHTEIDTPWVLPASRLWPRGASLSSHDFWEQFTPTPWFTHSWNQKKYLVDFWHKPIKPAWWSNALWVNINIDNNELHRKLLFSKVFEYNPETKTVIWTSQVPNYGRTAAIANKAKYQNQCEWQGIDNLDDFYNTVVSTIECFKWDNTTTDKSIALSELFDVDKVVNFLLQFEDQLHSKLDVACVRAIHKHWTDATNRLL